MVAEIIQKKCCFNFQYEKIYDFHQAPFNIVTKKGKLVTLVLFLVKKLQFIFYQNKANWEISCAENGEKCKIYVYLLYICTFTLSSGLLIPLLISWSRIAHSSNCNWSLVYKWSTQWTISKHSCMNDLNRRYVITIFHHTYKSLSPPLNLPLVSLSGCASWWLNGWKHENSTEHARWCHTSHEYCFISF